MNEHVLTGCLSAYAEEPSVGTLEYRISTGDIVARHDAYIAVGDCSMIGKTDVMTYIETGLELDVQVFDFSGLWDCGVVDGESTLTAGGYVAELDYAAWQAWGLGRVSIEFVDAAPHKDVDKKCLYE